MNQRALETLINLIWQSGNVQRSPIDSDPTARLERQQQIRRKRLQKGKVDVAGKGNLFHFKGKLNSAWKRDATFGLSKCPRKHTHKISKSTRKTTTTMRM